MSKINFRLASSDSEQDMRVFHNIQRSVADPKIYKMGLLDENEVEKRMKDSTVLFIQYEASYIGTLEYKIESHMGYITALAIHPEFQKRGFAKMAVRLLIKDLKKEVRKFRLVTHGENNRALLLYLSLGFLIQDTFNIDEDRYLVLELSPKKKHVE